MSGSSSAPVPSPSAGACHGISGRRCSSVLAEGCDSGRSAWTSDSSHTVIHSRRNEPSPWPRRFRSIKGRPMKALAAALLVFVAACGQGNIILNVDVLSFLSASDSTTQYNVIGGLPPVDSTVSRRFSLPPGLGKSTVDSISASFSSQLQNATGGGRVTLEVFFAKSQGGLFTGTPYLSDSSGHVTGAQTVPMGTNSLRLADSVFTTDSLWVGIRARIATDVGPNMTGQLRLTDLHVRVVLVGNAHPIVVQSMTNTDTADAAATAAQVRALHAAGSELVRVTVNTDEAARAVPAIVAEVDVPVIGDFHYNGHLLLTKYPACARALAKYRINPGNVGTKRRDDNFRTIIEVALANGKPVRIGVNWGSLDQQLLTGMMDENARRSDPLDAREVMIEAMLASATRSAELAEECGLGHDRIILSAKVSGVQDLVDVYQRLAERCDYPLHLGLTEAGMGAKGIIASTAGLSILLQEGIGDTIRVSLTPRPGGDRTEEVQVAQQVLQSLGLRSFTPQVSACPGCGRTTSTFFQEMAEDIQTHLK